MRQSKIILGTFVFVLIVSSSITAQDVAESNFESLHKLILPGKNDSQWMSVSWMPATNIWAARQKAAVEGKPIFLWYMAGEPLGPC